MAKLNVIPVELQNEINNFFAHQNAAETEIDLFEMFSEYIASPSSSPETNASKAHTYRSLSKLVFLLEFYLIKGNNLPPSASLSLN